jgi:RHH-type transcriptional regulator, rel operon repressor / antitoxin RelB
LLSETQISKFTTFSALAWMNSRRGVDDVAHEGREDLVGRVGVLDLDLVEPADLGIERRLPELLRVHLAEPFVALHGKPIAAEAGRSHQLTPGVGGRLPDPMLDYVGRLANRAEAMTKETISVRIPSEKKAALDAIAAQTDRDVSLVIEEAVNAYLDLHAWQRAHIGEGVRQADAGEFASEAEVRAAFARWRS